MDHIITQDKIRRRFFATSLFILFFFGCGSIRTFAVLFVHDETDSHSEVRTVKCLGTVASCYLRITMEL